jgi:hypothetical protein
MYTRRKSKLSIRTFPLPPMHILPLDVLRERMTN